MVGEVWVYHIAVLFCPFLTKLHYIEFWVSYSYIFSQGTNTFYVINLWPLKQLHYIEFWGDFLLSNFFSKRSSRWSLPYCRPFLAIATFIRGWVSNFFNLESKTMGN